MSSRARKLAQRIELTQRQSSGILHGCEECRSTEFRQQLTRELVVKGLISDPPLLECPRCASSWRVKFSADSQGQALVTFSVPVLS